MFHWKGRERDMRRKKHRKTKEREKMFWWCVDSGRYVFLPQQHVSALLAVLDPH